MKSSIAHLADIGRHCHSDSFNPGLPYMTKFYCIVSFAHQSSSSSLVIVSLRGGGHRGRGYQIPTSLPISPFHPHFPPPVRIFPPHHKILLKIEHQLKHSQEPKLIISSNNSLPKTHLHFHAKLPWGQRVKRYFSLFGA